MKKNNVIELFPAENGNLALITDERQEKSKYKKRGKVAGSGKKKGKTSEVESIQDLEILKKMRSYFIEIEFNKSENINKKITAIKHNLIFTIGINTALRISDILKLTWKELLSGEKFTIQEKKTQKFNTRYINKDISQAVELYINILKKYNIEFTSDDKVFDYTTQGVIKFLKRAAKECGSKQNIGTHTMRKTFSYWFLMNNKGNSRALQVLCEILNHSSEKVTLRYAGITENEKKDVFYEMSDFYQKVDRGEVRIYDDKITVSKGQVEELIQYAYTLGKENANANLDTDLDNLSVIKSLLKENILT